ncbi:MAG TPA: hypothetical protein VFZ61_01020 [Polyangiales bacterium]
MQGSQPQDDAQLRGNREAALSEVLSSYVEPRSVSYRFVAAFVVLGLLGCISIAWAASAAPLEPPVRFEQGTSGLMERGVVAFNRGDWDEAERLLRQVAARSPQPLPRLEDYMERLALIRRDGDRLAHAEEALEADEPERALEQLAAIGANSPLFAQAEVLGRAARAQVEAAAHAREADRLEAEAGRLEAEAERQASGGAVARTLPPAPEAPPRSPRRRGKHGADRVRSDEAW